MSCGIEWTNLGTIVPILLGIGILGCLFSSKFAFACRDISCRLLIIFLAALIIPLMAFRGRDVTNLRWCLRGLILVRWIFGISGNIRGSENLIRDKPCVIVCNHQSIIDLFGMADIMPQNTTVLAKKELLYFGPIGLCFWLSGVIFVDRSSREDSQKAMKQTAEEIMRRKVKVWMYPEGTRNRGEGMLPFKKGAFNLAVQAQIPIVPVVFRSHAAFYNPRESLFNRGTYVLEVLRPIETSGLGMEDVPKLCEDTRNIMLEAHHRLNGIG